MSGHTGPHRRGSSLALQADRVARRLWPGLLAPPPLPDHTEARASRWKLQLTIPELRRVTALLTASVAQGAADDTLLRDRYQNRLTAALARLEYTRLRQHRLCMG